MKRYRILIPKEDENRINEMVNRGVSSRKIAKETGYNHMLIYRRFAVPKQKSERLFEMEHPRKSLTINIETETLDCLQKQNGNLNDSINERLSDWFKRTRSKEASQQILVALKNRSTKFRDGRRKYLKTVKKIVRIRKDILKKLKTMQEEIDKRLLRLLQPDYSVHLVKPSYKGTLAETTEIWEEETGCSGTRKPIISIAQIINVILASEPSEKINRDG